MSNKVYEIITDRIVKSLEGGVVPWRTPWRMMSPKNLISGKAYRGVNVFLLASQRYSSSYWLTYKQAQDKGGQVRKGEKSTPIVYYRVFDDKKPDPKTGKVGKRFVLRFYNVFNVTQCDDINVPFEADGGQPFSPVEGCEKIITKYIGRGPRVQHGGDRAFYSPSEDLLQMPTKESFSTPAEYYSTRFHEMVHSTGHKDRLNREGITNPIKFASHDYSFEELVAECGAAFLCGEAGVLDVTFDNSAAYIHHWVSKLRSEPTWIVKAGGQAAKAADYILSRKADGSDEGDEAPDSAEEKEED